MGFLFCLSLAFSLALGGGAADVIDENHGPFNPLTTVPVRYVDGPHEFSAACPQVTSPCYGTYDPTNDADMSTCTILRGSLIVSGALKYPPTCLQEIEGDVVIQNNNFVTSMFGFSSLQKIGGSLTIRNNSYFTSLRGLDSLKVVNGSIHLGSLNALISLSALDAAVFSQGDVGEAWYDRQRREYVVDPSDPLDGFVQPVDDEELHFARRARSRQHIDPLSTTLFESDTLESFKDLHGLGNLTTVGGDFVVRDNVELINLKGADSIQTIGGSLIFKYNFRFQSFDGFGSLEEVKGNLRVIGNSKVYSMMGLQGLVTIGGTFQASKNTQLLSLSGLDSLETIGKDFLVHYNRRMTHIAFNGTLIPLKSVGGRFHIFDNARLSSVRGLEALHSIGSDVVIVHLPELLSLSGLGNISSMGGDVYIQTKMVDYTGLESLAAIGGALHIHALPNLVSLQGLENLESIGGSILAYMNKNLESIDALESLRTVGGKVNIHDNAKLKSVDAMLESLHEVGDYFQLIFQNGTIECPSGSGSGAHTNVTLLQGTGAPFGNWCTIRCMPHADLVRYPNATCTGESPLDVCHTMWKCREEDMWNVTWAPRCSDR